MARTAPLIAYEILGVLPTDDFETIHRAWLRQYRECCLQIRQNSSSRAKKRLAQINYAHDAMTWHKQIGQSEFERIKAALKRHEDAKRRAKNTASKRQARSANHDRSCTERGTRRRPRRPKQDIIDAQFTIRSAIGDKFEAARAIFATRLPRSLRLI